MKTINVPDSWSEVTVTQFQELEATENIIEKIAILANEDPEYIRKMDIESFKRVSKALEWVHTMPDEKEGSEVLTIDDTKYYLIQMSSLSLGSWMDIEHYMQEPIQNIHKLMAIFYRESPNAEYNSITGAKRAELFLERMSVNDCYGTLVFFSLIEKKCLTTIKDYFQMQVLMMQVKQELKQKQNELREKRKKRKLLSGVGFRSLITWLKGTSQRWKR